MNWDNDVDPKLRARAFWGALVFTCMWVAVLVWVVR